MPSGRVTRASRMVAVERSLASRCWGEEELGLQAGGRAGDMAGRLGFEAWDEGQADAVGDRAERRICFEDLAGELVAAGGEAGLAFIAPGGVGHEGEAGARYRAVEFAALAK